MMGGANNYYDDLFLVHKKMALVSICWNSTLFVLSLVLTSLLVCLCKCDVEFSLPQSDTCQNFTVDDREYDPSSPMVLCCLV